MCQKMLRMTLDIYRFLIIYINDEYSWIISASDDVADNLGNTVWLLITCAPGAALREPQEKIQTVFIQTLVAHYFDPIQRAEHHAYPCIGLHGLQAGRPSVQNDGLNTDRLERAAFHCCKGRIRPLHGCPNLRVATYNRHRHTQRAVMAKFPNLELKLKPRVIWRHVVCVCVVAAKASHCPGTHSCCHNKGRFSSVHIFVCNHVMNG